MCVPITGDASGEGVEQVVLTFRTYKISHERQVARDGGRVNSALFQHGNYGIDRLGCLRLVSLHQAGELRVVVEKHLNHRMHAPPRAAEGLYRLKSLYAAKHLAGVSACEDLIEVVLKLPQQCVLALRYKIPVRVVLLRQIIRLY